MKQIACQLIRASAASWGGAAAGAALATAQGGTAGLIGLGGLLTIHALCLASGSFAESAEPESDIQSIEAWLKKTVDQQGGLDEALQAIAQGTVSHPSVSGQHAQAIFEIRRTLDDRLNDLLAQNATAHRILDGLAEHLTRCEPKVLQQLVKQAEQLDRMERGIAGVQNHLIEMKSAIDGTRKKIPSEEEIAARASDDEEHCRLRSARLQTLFDGLDWQVAETFANKDKAWLDRVQGGLSPQRRVDLLERLLQEATHRLKTADSTRRSAARSRLKDLIEQSEAILPLLTETEALSVTSMLGHAEAVLHGADAGLAYLKNRHDAHGIRHRLAILIDAGRHNEAWDLVRDEQPSEVWIRNGIRAAALSGNWEHAFRILTWATTYGASATQRLARLIIVDCAIHSQTEDVLCRAENRTPEGSERLIQCRIALRPLVDRAMAVSPPESKLDSIALQFEIALSIQLDTRERIAPIAATLARCRPLDTFLGQLAARGIIEAGPDWPRRLRSEGTPSFERLLLAARLEANQQESMDRAFRAARRLAEEASTTSERGRVLDLLMNIGQKLGEEERREVDAIAPGLVEPGDRQWQLWSVARLIEQGDTDEADERLAELRDPADPLWLQIHGKRCLQRGDIPTGVSELASAAKKLDRPDTLRDVAGLAASHEQWEHAADLLEQFLSQYPDDLEARSSRALALHRLGDDQAAADLFSVLAREQPDVPRHAMNASTCFLKVGKPDKAVEVLSTLCEQPNPPLQAIVGIAETLRASNEAKRAFKVLNSHRERFWGNFEFVTSYCVTAFAAELEDAGHEALMQLRTLQADGSAPDGLIAVKSLTDVVDLFKTQQSREDRFASAVLRGQAAWLMEGSIKREPAYRCWASRTGRYDWLFEHPINIANTTVYCSNGFTGVSNGKSMHLEEIVGSNPAQSIVADLTSLITLQMLDLLSIAADYCGSLIIPSEYLFKMISDNSDLLPHQPSRKTVSHQLRTVLIEGRVGVLSEPDSANCRILDEYYPPEDSPDEVYHLADLLNALRTAGAATSDELARLAKVAHRPPVSDEQNQSLEIADRLCVSFSTLSTLCTCGVIDLILDRFSVVITDQDRQRVLEESLWFESQEALREDHVALWEFLRDSPRVERVATPSLTENEPQQETALSAAAIADDRGLPLLADDRVLQAITFNRRPGLASASFGTAQLLKAMAENGRISEDRYADAVQRLMEWRYRFLLPDPDLMLHWARRSADFAPGRDLIVLARYQRACLRDPGLFGGFEPTNPPSTMAMKYYQAVESAVGEFIGSLWDDTRFLEEQAISFTLWSLDHLLPPPPATMGHRARMLSDFKQPFFWLAFLLRLAQSPMDGTSDRPRRAVRVVADALGMSFEVTLKQATEVIHGIGRERS